MKESNFKPRSRLRLKLLRNITVLALPFVLAACGGSGTGGDDNGGTPPPDSAFSTTYTLAADEFGADTWLQRSYLSEVLDLGRARYGALELVKVPDSRIAPIRYHRDEIPVEVNVVEYFENLLPLENGLSATLTVSDPDVSIKGAGSAVILHKDPAGTLQSLRSHSVELRHLFMRDGSAASTVMRLVYADGAATVRAAYVSSSFEVEAEIQLAEGWNLLYYENHFSGGTWTHTYRARTPSDDTPAETQEHYIPLDSFEPGYDVTYISVFSKTSLLASDPANYISSPYRHDGDSARTYLPPWIPGRITDVTLMAVDDLFGEPFSGSISGADELKVLLADLRTFADGTSWDDAAASNGTMRFVTAVGDHPVHLIYADRSGTVEFTDVVLTDSGTVIRTAAGGLSFSYGWNAVAAVPDITAPGTVTLTKVNWVELKSIAEQY